MLPSGSVTFLFTDIEGSSRLWDTAPEAMPEVLARHNRLVSGAISRRGGHIVKDKGDGFFAAFASPVDGVLAAVEAQRGLADQDWGREIDELRVRMALHTAQVEPEDGDYHGTDVNRVARLEAAAHGGQVLISDAAAESVRAILPAGYGTRDLGRHQLRGLAQSTNVFQIVTDDLPVDFPPIRTPTTAHARLPSPHTSFVGRDAELHRIGDILGNNECRLLTLVGPGGIGKTRLAIEAAHRLTNQHPHGAHFVPLASVTAPEAVVPAIGDSLGFSVDVQFSSVIDQRTQILDFVGHHAMLMVIDNYEHLLSGAEVLGLLLQEAPEVQLLVTSRERLNLQSEWVLEVGGMPLSGGGSDTSGDALELFIDRARRVDPSFSPTADELMHAGRICRLVEGMPLAVELAAAWVPILPCEEIADEIERSLDFLGASTRDVPDRHRTIRAAFDYSWNLLDPAQQEAFRGMSVFSAPFTRRAVDATVGSDLRTLTELVGKSLVRRVGSDRFDLHPLLRQYAGEKTDPADVGRLREHHARHYLIPLVGRRNDLKGSPDQAKARREISGDIGNVITAAQWAMAHWSDAEIIDVLDTLMRYYEIQSWSEGRERFRDLVDKIAGARSVDEKTLLATDLPYRRAMLAQGLFAASIGLTDEALSIVDSQRDLSWEADPPGRLWREVAAGVSEGIRGDYAAAERCFSAVYDEALALADPYLVVFLCTWYGWMLLELGNTGGAGNVLEVGRSTAIRENDTHGLAYVLSKMGLLADVSGDHRQAAVYHLEARETFLEFGDIGGQGYTLSRLAWTHWLLGEYAEARRYGLEGLELFEGNNHRWGVGVSLCRVGFSEIGLGDLASARGRFTEALDRSLEVQMDGITVYALIGIGNVLAASGESAGAVEILSVAARHPAVPTEYKRDYVEPVLTRLREEMGPDAFETAASRSVDWTVEDVIAAARAAPSGSAMRPSGGST